MAAVAPRPGRPSPSPAGPITVAGYFSATTGLGEGTRRLADMLDAAGAKVHRADLTRALRQNVARDLVSRDQVGEQTSPAAMVPAGPGTLIMHVNGFMLPWGMAALGRAAIAGKYVITFWNWELPVLPSIWFPGFRFAHRIWASSSFVAGAIRPHTRLPVEVVSYPVPPPQPSGLRRADFGLPDEAFIALSTFDASSSVERKNPIAAIRAHRSAFGEDPGRILVLKTYNTIAGGEAWRQVLGAAAGLTNIRIMDAEMTRPDLWALARCANVFVSLHRAEGVGLALAEAMSLGIPVIATGWSGNMDFMDGTNSFLVGYTLTSAKDEKGIYSVPGAMWAEPDVNDAATALRLVAEHPDRAREVARLGQARAATLTLEACGRHALALLNASV
jgi:glycosyltransferase involved in cell wall biosynthesis